ncbi:1601_t:CDS:2 [Paraglomus occultum]|uniref:1601_t:CDS:1 n=1 Tax=Paraglomus occultum TaxID=144539 RepID=A0A9N8ZN55_9GLOM|nr:1601_t:CDS:2 [Paraglomus occultum]
MYLIIGMRQSTPSEGEYKNPCPDVNCEHDDDECEDILDEAVEASSVEKKVSTIFFN